MNSRKFINTYSKGARFFVICNATILCVILNFFFNFLAISVFHVPLFLDTIGTVTVTLAFGWIPGLVCAFLTTTLDGIIGGYYFGLPFLYVICAFAAVFITFFFKKYIFNSSSRHIRFCYLFILSVAMCIVISVLGGLIDTFVSQHSSFKAADPVASDFFKPSFIKIGLSSLGTNIAARFPVNIIDRLITSFGAYEFVALYNIGRQKVKAAQSKSEVLPPPTTCQMNRQITIAMQTVQCGVCNTRPLAA